MMNVENRQIATYRVLSTLLPISEASTIEIKSLKVYKKFSIQYAFGQTFVYGPLYLLRTNANLLDPDILIW